MRKWFWRLTATGFALVLAVSAGCGANDGQVLDDFFADAEAGGWFTTSGSAFVRLDPNLDYHYLPRDPEAGTELENHGEGIFLGRVTVARDGRTIAATTSTLATASQDPILVVFGPDLTPFDEFADFVNHDTHTAYRWSPDGTKLSTARGNSIFVIDVVTGRVDTLDVGHAPTVRDGLATGTPSWSGDGSRLVFQTVDDQVAIVAVASGAVEVIAEGFLPSWSPDGATITYRTDRSTGEVIAYDVDSGDTRELFSIENSFQHTLAWTPDSRNLLFPRGVVNSIYGDLLVYSFDHDTVVNTGSKIATMRNTVVVTLDPLFEQQLRPVAADENPNRR
ncbi:MAG: hypothetical protein GY708_06575 [Actinomycetia bacterium]|nr:hypothetical protein [Actinomycetes bacterium]